VACISSGELGSKGAGSVHGFLQLVERLGAEIRDLPLHEQVDQVINASGLIDHHKKEKADRGEARVENLLELVSAARGFEPEGTDGEAMPPLESFLAHAVLESGEGQAEAWEDCIQMMTLHTAKGLEFPVVFLAGMEDGLFPHQRSLNDLEGLEEERRLCYVGTTRAMRHLYITYAEQRRLHGVDSYGMASRFISEYPEELIEEVRPRIQAQRPFSGGYRGAATGTAAFGGGREYASPPRTAASPSRGNAMLREDAVAPGIRLGAHVKHAKFGDGVVLNIEGQGPNARIQVNFERHGSKVLMLGLANLQPA
jgi:DNA helicase-2/ATP-dependent DNA helicase PcrA